MFLIRRAKYNNRSVTISAWFLPFSPSWPAVTPVPTSLINPVVPTSTCSLSDCLTCSSLSAPPASSACYPSAWSSAFLPSAWLGLPFFVCLPGFLTLVCLLTLRLLFLPTWFSSHARGSKPLNSLLSRRWYVTTDWPRRQEPSLKCQPCFIRRTQVDRLKQTGRKCYKVIKLN